MNSDITEESKLLATLSTYKVLYEQKKNPYDIAAEFLKYAIVIDQKSAYRLCELAELVREQFGIDIPQVVIKAAISRVDFVKRVGLYEYDVDEAIIEENTSFVRISNTSMVYANEIIIKFNEYIKQSKPELLNAGERILDKAFLNYIIDEKNDDYSDVISGFISH